MEFRSFSTSSASHIRLLTGSTNLVLPPLLHPRPPVTLPPLQRYPVLTSRTTECPNDLNPPAPSFDLSISCTSPHQPLAHIRDIQTYYYSNSHTETHRLLSPHLQDPDPSESDVTDHEDTREARRTSRRYSQYERHTSTVVETNPFPGVSTVTPYFLFFLSTLSPLSPFCLLDQM